MQITFYPSLTYLTLFNTYPRLLIKNYLINVKFVSLKELRNKQSPPENKNNNLPD